MHFKVFPQPTATTRHHVRTSESPGEVPFPDPVLGVPWGMDEIPSAHFILEGDFGDIPRSLHLPKAVFPPLGSPRPALCVINSPCCCTVIMPRLMSRCVREIPVWLLAHPIWKSGCRLRVDVYQSIDNKEEQSHSQGLCLGLSLLELASSKVHGGGMGGRDRCPL